MDNSGITEGHEMTAQRNHRLERALSDSGMTRNALARAVRDLSAADGGQLLSTDHTAITRWLGGMVPRGRTAGFVVETLSKRMGRPLSLSDVGFDDAAVTAPDLGLTYAHDLNTTVMEIGQLWRADLAGDPVLARDPSVAAWSNASLTWLVGTRTPVPAERPEGRRVGMAQIMAVRATADAFAGLDNRFGGDHARTALLRFLADDVQPLLTGRHTEPVRQALFTAAAEATLLAAWMSYDACRHGVAQRYFIQALRLADAGGDRLLAGSVMSAMSHQATFLGRYRDAAELARAGVAGIASRGTDTLRAQFHAMEARALSRLGDRRACDMAMADAVRHFERRDVGADPVWISYFDDAELAAELGHCHRDLGRAIDAVTYAGHSLSPDGSYVRSDFFATMVLADSHAVAGDLEQAAGVAGQALALGAALKSARCGSYLREFRDRLTSAGGTSVLKQLAEEHAEHPIWLASDAA